MKKENGYYNWYTNTTTTYNSSAVKFQKNSINPINKNFDFNEHFCNENNLFILNIYYTFINYFISNYKIEGTDDLSFDGEDLMFKILNGSCGLYKFRNEIWPINVSISSFNFLNKPIEVRVNEPKSSLLNNKIIKTKKSTGDFDDFQEIRFNYNRSSLLILIWNYLQELKDIWKLTILEKTKIFDKNILNSNIVNQDATLKEFLEVVEVTDKNLYLLDFKSAGLEEFDKGNEISYFKLEYGKETTERIITKWDFVEKQIFKILGIKFNNKEEKNNANLVSKEITQEEERGKIIAQAFSDIINLDLKKANKKFGLNLKLVIKSEKIEKEMNEEKMQKVSQENEEEEKNE